MFAHQVPWGSVSLWLTAYFQIPVMIFFVITLWCWQAPFTLRFMMFTLFLMVPTEQSHFNYIPSVEVTGAIK